MAAKGTETVTVFEKGTRDRVNNVVDGPEKGVLTRCIIFPRSTDESSDRGTITIEGYNVWAPAPIGFPLSSTDVVVARGRKWSVEGVPGDWRNKRGKKLGVLLTLQKFSG